MGSLAWTVAFAFLSCGHAYHAVPKTVVILGAQGRLGRELVYQSLNRGCRVVGIVRRPQEPVLTPIRRGWLSEDGGLEATQIQSSRLQLVDSAQEEDVGRAVERADAVLITLSGSPFQRVNTSALVSLLARSAPHEAKICYVSAYGTGASVKGSSMSIRAMRAWYLRSVYESKQREEDLVLRESKCRGVCVMRPRVLSHAPIPLNKQATPRYQLGREMLDWALE